MTTALKKSHSICTHATNGDPTRTLSLRNAFASEMGRRFRQLQAVIKKAIIDDDCFGLEDPRLGNILAFVELTSPGRKAFAFPRSADKVQAFMDWLQEQVDHGILEISEKAQLGSAVEGAWTNKYVKQSYERGVMRGRRELLKHGYGVPTLEQTGGLLGSFTQPFHIDRAGLLYTRTFNDLKGITNAMETLVSRTLSQGIAEGIGPAELARQINRTIGSGLGMTDTLGRYIPPARRAKILARTEVIRAHHQATIQEYRNWGVEGVEVLAEWETAGDQRVCPDCDALQGHEFTLDEIESMIPLHPQCRCVAIPKEVGKGRLAPGTTVAEPIEEFDISEYPDDFAKISKTKQMAQATWTDTQALIEVDLSNIRVGEATFTEIAEGETFRVGAHTDIIIDNMQGELKLYQQYLAGDTMSLTRDYVDDFHRLLRTSEGNLASAQASTLNEMGVDSIRKLIMQEIESNRQQFTDHGIRHIVGNIKRQQKILDLVSAKNPFANSPMERLKGMTTMINHDVGYTTPLVRKGGFRGIMASGSHPEYSTKIMKEQRELWNVGKVFSRADYSKMLKIVQTHDGTALDIADDVLGFATRIADNTALYAKDKLPSMFQYVDGGEQILVDMGHAAKAENKVLFEKLRKKLEKAIDDTDRFSMQLKRDLKAGTKEISHMSPKFTMGTLGGEMTEMYGSTKSWVVMEVEHNKWDQFLSHYFDMGQGQIKKLMKDYGAKFVDNVLTLGEFEGKNLLEIKMLKSPMPLMSDITKASGIFDDAYRASTVEQYAKTYKMTYAQAVTDMEKGLGVALEDTAVWTRHHASAFEDILTDRRMKTQFETGTSSGALDPKGRSVLEDIIVGVTDVAPRNKPLYGYLSDLDDGEMDSYALSHYGDFAFKLKPKTKSFTTFTLGDSLDNNQMPLRDFYMERLGQRRDAPKQLRKLTTVASPVEDPKWYAFQNNEPMWNLTRGETEDVLEHLHSGALGQAHSSFAGLKKEFQFIEAQVHGGVTLEDVAEIVVGDTKANRKLVAEFQDVLDEYKIKVDFIETVIDEGVDFY